MNNVTFVICSAGEGTRMSAISKDRPKHLVRLKGKTLLEWSLASLPFRSGDQLLLLTQAAFPGTVQTENILRAHNSSHVQTDIVYLNQTTRGQAETALLAKPYVRHERLAIFNSDTYFQCARLDSLIHDSSVEFLAPCYQTSGTEWSFFKTDEHGPLFSVKQVTEKVRISDWCSTGFYYFHKKDRFFDLVSKELHKSLGAQELYIAPLYNSLLDHGVKVVACEEFKPMGTPQQIETFWQVTPKELENENR